MDAMIWEYKGEDRLTSKDKARARGLYLARQIVCTIGLANSAGLR
jgi:hypothetical protein